MANMTMKPRRVLFFVCVAYDVSSSSAEQLRNTYRDRGAREGNDGRSLGGTPWWDRNVCEDVEYAVDYDCDGPFDCVPLGCSDLSPDACDAEYAQSVCPATCEIDCESVPSVVAQDGAFGQLAAVLEAADLITALGGAGPFGAGLTVLAPNDGAFAELIEGNSALVDKYLTEPWRAHLRSLLLYHVIPGEARAADLVDGLRATALNREIITAIPGPVFVDSVGNEVPVVRADIVADNGVVHEVGSVLIPSSVKFNVVDMVVAAAGDEDDPEFTILLDLVGRVLGEASGAVIAERLGGPGPLTVFAPTDRAFLKLGQDALDSLTVDQIVRILEYHVVDGANILSRSLSRGDQAPTLLPGKTVVVTSTSPFLRINCCSQVVARDVLVNNGVVHVIDSVLDPDTECGIDADGPFTPEGRWNWRGREYTCDQIARYWQFWRECYCHAFGITEYCPQTCNVCGAPV